LKISCDLTFWDSFSYFYREKTKKERIWHSLSSFRPYNAHLQRFAIFARVRFRRHRVASENFIVGFKLQFAVHIHGWWRWWK